MSDAEAFVPAVKRQVESGCKDAPIVIESRREEIEAECKKVVELLSKHGARD
jgi:hypothetical protein